MLGIMLIVMIQGVSGQQLCSIRRLRQRANVTCALTNIILFRPLLAYERSARHFRASPLHSAQLGFDQMLLRCAEHEVCTYLEDELTNPNEWLLPDKIVQKHANVISALQMHTCLRRCCDSGVGYCNPSVPEVLLLHCRI